MRNKDFDAKRCPICGKLDTAPLVAVEGNQHRCSEKTLQGIDAAHRRNDIESQHDWPSVQRRLYDGLLWQSQDELDDGDEQFSEEPNF